MDRTTLLLAILTTLEIIIGAGLVLFTQHTDEGISLIVVGLALASIVGFKQYKTGGNAAESPRSE